MKYSAASLDVEVRRSHLSKHDRVHIDERLLAMARVYSKCSSLEEFFIEVDLQQLEPVSWWRWTNPFAVHNAMKRRAVQTASGVFPLFFIFAALLAGGLAGLAFTAAYAAAMSLKIWLESKAKAAEARCALRQVEQVEFEDWCEENIKWPVC